MIEIPIETIATRTAETIGPDEPVSVAAQRLRDPDVPALVVCEDDRVVGVVTESDVVAYVAETVKPCPVETIMSRPPVTIAPEESVTTGADRMATHGVRVLPIVDDTGYCGIVTASRLAPYLSRRRLEIEWQDDPVRIDTDGALERPVGD